MNFKDWKLKLRYGKEKTPYKHFTLLADSAIGELQSGFSCPSENAIVSCKMWAIVTKQRQYLKTLDNK